VTTDKELALDKSEERQRTIFLYLACLAVPAIAILSFLPPWDKAMLHTRGKFHSWGHLLAFAVIAYFVARAARTARGKILLFVFSLIFGVGIEVSEHLMFGAPVEWKDVLVDALGVIAGTLMAMLTTPAARKPNSF
jgi:hypothetical protein